MNVCVDETCSKKPLWVLNWVERLYEYPSIYQTSKIKEQHEKLRQWLRWTLLHTFHFSSVMFSPSVYCCWVAHRFNSVLSCSHRKKEEVVSHKPTIYLALNTVVFIGWLVTVIKNVSLPPTVPLIRVIVTSSSKVFGLFDYSFQSSHFRSMQFSNIFLMV